MKYKKIILPILLLFIGIYTWYMQFEAKSSHKTYKSEEEFLVPKKLEIEITQSNKDENSTISFASENNETDHNIDYFREIYSIIAPQNNATDQIEVGRGIEVENFFDSQNEYSYFIPLFSNDRVVAVSIFREYLQGEKKLGRIGEIRENWFSYPPVILSDAINALQNKYPDVVTNHISGHYYIEDGETPYYLFQSSDGNATQYYLVSAYDKHIVIKRVRKPKSISEDPAPGWIDSKGYLEINETQISKLSYEEQIQLIKEADMTNHYIRNGVMKFDQDMNIIFDKRTEEDFKRERMLYEEGSDKELSSDNDEILFTIDSSDLSNTSLE